MNSNKDVTIYDIATAVNVSPATVSRALKDHPGIRNETKRKIREAAQKMGYRHNTFASNLRRKQTNTIGVIVPRLNSYFMATVIGGMEKVANITGYNLLITQSLDSVKKEEAGVNTMFNSRADGLLVSLANDTIATDHFDTILSKSIPLIFFDRIVELPNCTCIVIDNKKAGYDATLHLINGGCKRIVHICGSLHRNVYSDRLDGYKQALARKGIPFDPALIINSNLSDQGSAESARQILKMDELPDGVFASNDTTAVACIRELKQAGIRVPDQISIVGFNNDPISKVIEPNLTTIHYPGEEMGEVAASTLINRLKNLPAPSPNTIVLKHELIIRQSSMRKNNH